MRGALSVHLLCAAILGVLHGSAVIVLPVRADWTDELRMTLANYAYYKTATLPRDFLCTYKGNLAQGCNCWNSKGDKNSAQDKGGCDQPPKCMAYDVSHDGTFRSGVLRKAKDVDGALKAWGVPKAMHGDFQAAVLFDSSTFVAFSTELVDSTGRVEAHVGSARRDPSGKIFLGWVYGKANANLIEPRKRVVGSGDCEHRCIQKIWSKSGTSTIKYNPECGTKKRGFRSEELAAINEALFAYAFAEAANMADRGRRLRGGDEERAERVPSVLAPQEAPVVAP